MLEVLRGVDLRVPAGELTATLGPSGCGKTTLLRLVVGFEMADSGVISIGERVVCDGGRGLSPERRGVGYVAQEGALFPHLTVAANITFGLPRQACRARARVDELLELVGMRQDHARRYPHQLSGGQQQRVALARALAPRPSIVLLDEPFSSLDAGLRAQTRCAVVDALAASDTTAVLVTHDQSEALSVADRVAIMRDGRLVQTAAPAELYRTPADTAVAGFVGEAVVLPAVVANGVADCALGRLPVRAPARTGLVTVMVRPEQIVIRSLDFPAGVAARIVNCTYYGHDAAVTARLAGDGTLVSSRCAGYALPHPGDEVTLAVSGDAIAYPPPAAAPSAS